MAKKKDNTLLYAGIGLAAFLLFKKNNNGVSGIGARKLNMNKKNFNIARRFKKRR